MDIMKRIKNHSEVLISGLIAISFIVLGIFILFNHNRIRTGEAVDPEFRIKNVFDLINTFFSEVSLILNNIIAGFPIIAGILLIIMGVGMFKIMSIIKNTTEHDVFLSFFFIALSFLFFVFTTILMYQVYGWFSILFFIAFMIHMLYNIFNEYFNPTHKKEHYLIILMIYAFAYFFTQYRVYSDIDNLRAPTDVLSINMFFAVVWVLSLMALSVGVFLSKSKNLIKKPLPENSSQYSRRMKHKRINPNKYLGFSKGLYNFRNLFLEKTLNFLEVNIPKWLKVGYIELFLGTLATIIILIEFNNRQNVFFEGYFNISQTTHIYEWVNLFLTLVLALSYIFFTFFNLTQNKFYHRQMIIIFALWLKVSVSLFITVFVDVELSLFILPFNILLVILTTPLLLISVFKDFSEGVEH